jgi:hypothetical protein
MASQILTSTRKTHVVLDCGGRDAAFKPLVIPQLSTPRQNSSAVPKAASRCACRRTPRRWRETLTHEKRFVSWTAVAVTPLLRGQFIPDIYSAPRYNPPSDAIHPRHLHGEKNDRTAGHLL